jgi:hypothetical protein
VEEYRLHHEPPTDAGMEPAMATPRRARGPSGAGRAPGGPSRAYVALVAAVVAIIILLIVALISGGSSGKSGTTAAHTTAHKGAHAHHARPTASAAPALVSLSLRPSATVYVCLLGDGGRKLIPGVELPPGESTPTYHARRFQITLGNSSVTMVIDGKPRSVPASSEAIGYSITKAAGRKPLAAGQLPTCA